MPVNSANEAYEEMIKTWEKCRDMYGGSESIKAKGDMYLPRLFSHRDGSPDAEQDYDAYKHRALVLNATGRTVDGLAGAVYQKPPTVDGTLTEEFKDDMKDVTLSGVNLDLFGLEVLRENVKVGRVGILLDMPPIKPQKEGDPIIPVLDRPRPYWISYRAEQVINWAATRIDGKQVTTMVVLAEKIEKQGDDPFKPDCIDQFRVLWLRNMQYEVEIWQKDDKATGDEKDKWAIVDKYTPVRRLKPLDFIPFVFVNKMSNLPNPSKPPLLDLVEVNLSHYRGSADLKHGLHFTALPTPWVSGMKASQSGDKDGPLRIGSGEAWELDKDGSAGMLEFSGAGLGAIRQDLQDMQKQMAVLGARLLEESPSVGETLGAVSMRHAGEHATLRTICEATEAALTMLLRWHVWWAGTATTPEDVDLKVELNKEYFSFKVNPEFVKTMFLMVQDEKISYATFYNGLKTGEWTREKIDAEEEMEEIRNQDPLTEEEEEDPLDPNADPMDPNADPANPNPPVPPIPPKKPVPGKQPPKARK